MKRWGATWVALVTLMKGGSALAHPPPMGTGVWWLPPPGAATAGASRERMVIRTPRGFLLESTATNDFRLLCNEAVGIQDGETASFADLKGSVLLMSTYARGVLRGGADGCAWTQVSEVVTAPAFDVIVSGPELTAYVVGGAHSEGDHFWAGQGSGTTWSALANSDVPYTRVRAAPSSPMRLYLTGIGLNASGMAVHRLGMSDDAGKTVVDRIVNLGPNDLQARVLDVDPLRPDHLYVYVESNSAELPEHILVSDDGGQSFTAGPTLHDIQGFAQSDDGKRVWVGGKEGVYRSTDGGGSFAPLDGDAMTSITCLAFHESQLYACGVLNNRELVVAVSEDDGGSFKKFFSFDRVTQTVDCSGADPATAPASVCAGSLAHWRFEVASFDQPPPATGGAAAGGSGGAGGVVSPLRSSGCAVGGAAGADRLATLLFLLAFAARRALKGRKSA